MKFTLATFLFIGLCFPFTSSRSLYNCVCPPLPSNCNAIFDPPDQCCPGCIITNGCDVHGEVIGVHSWKPDPCTTCTCVSGAAHCTIQGCVTPACPTPVVVPVGQCCPVCPLHPGIPVYVDSQAGATDLVGSKRTPPR